MTLLEIARITGPIFGVKSREMFGAGRTGRVTRARKAAWLISWAEGYSLQQIATRFNRHHGTVHHGVASARRALAEDIGFARRFTRAARQTGLFDDLGAIDIARRVLAPSRERQGASGGSSEQDGQPSIRLVRDHDGAAKGIRG